MGRGRAKAIQKRIARDLKYSTTGTDLDRLRAELAASGGGESAYDDPYADDPYADDDADGDEDAAPV